jgi:hypothetical protein
VAKIITPWSRNTASDFSSEPVVNVGAYGPAFERTGGSEVTVIREAGPALARARQGLVKKGWLSSAVSAETGSVSLSDFSTLSDIK